MSAADPAATQPRLGIGLVGHRHLPEDGVPARSALPDVLMTIRATIDELNLPRPPLLITQLAAGADQLGA